MAVVYSCTTRALDVTWKSVWIYARNRPFGLHAGSVYEMWPLGSARTFVRASWMVATSAPAAARWDACQISRDVSKPITWARVVNAYQRSMFATPPLAPKGNGRHAGVCWPLANPLP